MLFRSQSWNIVMTRILEHSDDSSGSLLRYRSTTANDVIPEEEDDESETVNVTPQKTKISNDQIRTTTHPVDVLNPASKEERNDGSPSATQVLVSALGGSASQPRKSSTRRNAWGNYSYAQHHLLKRLFFLHCMFFVPSL